MGGRGFRVVDSWLVREVRKSLRVVCLVVGIGKVRVGWDAWVGWEVLGNWAGWDGWAALGGWVDWEALGGCTGCDGCGDWEEKGGWEV